MRLVGGGAALTAGGAANGLAAAVAVGAPAVAAGVLGGAAPQLAAVVTAELAAAGVSTAGVSVDEQGEAGGNPAAAAVTPVCAVVTCAATGAHVFLATDEAPPPVGTAGAGAAAAAAAATAAAAVETASEQVALTPAMAAVLGRSRTLALSGYALLGTDARYVVAAMAAVAAGGGAIWYDPASAVTPAATTADRGSYGDLVRRVLEAADGLFLTADEAEVLVRGSPDDDGGDDDNDGRGGSAATFTTSGATDAAHLVKRLAAIAPAATLMVIKEGAAGATVWTRSPADAATADADVAGWTPFRIPAVALAAAEVVDTTGAGDSFLGAYAAAAGLDVTGVIGATGLRLPGRPLPWVPGDERADGSY
ncbi:hypothetical protein MMPV_000165 [Pyropia vietnamensis]